MPFAKNPRSVTVYLQDIGNGYFPLTQEVSPDDGSITMPSESTLGFLHQEMELPKGKSVIDETKDLKFGQTGYLSDKC